MGGHKQNTYLGLRANTVAAINPDVLGHIAPFLVKTHIFHELGSMSALKEPLEFWESFKLTFSVLEMVVDSA